MKKKHLLSMILTFPLFLTVLNLITIPAQAQQQSLIGDPAYKQKECFDSNPTIGGTSGTGPISPIGATIANVYDGNISTEIEWVIGRSTRGFVNVTGFKKPSDNGLADFNISYIDIKIHYRFYGVSFLDDEYRIVFYLGGDTIELQTWVTGQNARWPHDVNSPQTRPFSNVAKPGGGNWSWTDLANLRIGFESRLVQTNDFTRIDLHEIWITAYSTPYPEASTVSVQPSIISGPVDGNSFYVDLYVTNVTRMWNYEIFLKFNPTLLNATAWHNYDPFTIQSSPSEIGLDYVFLRYKTYTGDPVGFTGNTPICRIYFQVKVANDSLLHFESAYFEDVQSHPFTLRAVDGYYRIIEGDSEAPAIQTVSRSALSPNYDEDVTITANVSDNVQVANVTLSYVIASQWHNSTMTQVGGLYNAVIPAQPYNTTVEYRVSASDTAGNWATSDTFTYAVTDDFAPLVNSARIPYQPRNNQTVKITVNATEPGDASGVRTVWFTYRVDGGPESFVKMTYNELSSLWEGILPGQSAHAVVEYQCNAEDNVGNRNMAANGTYTVALAGDANLDHVVNVVDAAAISAHWHPGPPAGLLGYDSSYDLNGDGVIGIVDGAMVSADWNKTW